MRRSLLLLCSLLIAIGIGVGLIIEFSGSTGKSNATIPSVSSYTPATTDIIPKLAVLQRLARAVVRTNDDAAVHAGLVVLTTREKAAGGDIVDSNQPVYELIIAGRFICTECSHPSSAATPTGSYLAVTIDRSTLATTDFGIVPHRPVIPASSRVYSFRF